MFFTLFSAPRTPGPFCNQVRPQLRRIYCRSSAKSQNDSTIKADLLAYFEAHPDEKIGTKDADALLYRYRVSESFVKTPPFAGIDHHRPLLQRAGHSLPASPNLTGFIPKIEKAELATLQSELDGQYVGLAFDGTTRLGEARGFCTVLGRFEARKTALPARRARCRGLHDGVDAGRCATGRTRRGDQSAPPTVFR